ncbi:MAG: AMP-binding protein [Acidimicrobiia bacterium]
MSAPWVPSVADRYDDETVKRFYDEGFWRDEVLTDYLDRWCQSQPETVYATDGHLTLTYAELQGRAYRLAAALRRLGVGAGDRVVVQLPNWSEFAVSYVALARLGAILVPIMTIYRHDEVAYIADFAGARGIVTTGDFRGFDYLGMVREIRPQCGSVRFVVAVRASAGPDELTFEELTAGDGVPGDGDLGPAPGPDEAHICIFTSGTESRPKGCVHTFNTFATSLRGLGASLGVQPGDTTFMPSPVAHATGLAVGVGVPLVAGTSTHLLDAWDPAVGLARIAEHRCTNTLTAAPFVQMALDAFDPGAHDMSSMRAWGCAGAPIPPSMVERAAELWPSTHILSAYGRSETFLTTVCALDDPVERSVSSDGKPFTGVDLAIIDDEIVQRGPGVLVGYWNNPELTGQAFDADGWCHSGDLGRLDDRGYLRVTGRSKDIIIRGGANISAREVEDHLRAHPKIADVAVVAMPDEKLGERACAFVVLRAGSAAPGLDELKEFLTGERKVSVTKVPERLEVIDALPMTATGKVQKFALRDRIRRLLETSG